MPQSNPIHHSPITIRLADGELFTATPDPYSDESAVTRWASLIRNPDSKWFKVDVDGDGRTVLIHSPPYDAADTIARRIQISNQSWIVVDGIMFEVYGSGSYLYIYCGSAGENVSIDWSCENDIPAYFDSIRARQAILGSRALSDRWGIICQMPGCIPWSERMHYYINGMRVSNGNVYVHPQDNSNYSEPTDADEWLEYSGGDPDVLMLEPEWTHPDGTPVRPDGEVRYSNHPDRIFLRLYGDQLTYGYGYTGTGAWYHRANSYQHRRPSLLVDSADVRTFTCCATAAAIAQCPANVFVDTTDADEIATNWASASRASNANRRRISNVHILRSLNVHQCDCGTWSTMSEDPDGHRCNACATEHANDEEDEDADENDGTIVHDYCYHPDYSYIGAGPLFVGTEIEFELCSARRADVESWLSCHSGFENWFYLKDDGSLEDGIELVTHPISVDKWNATYTRGLCDILKKLRSMGCRAHNTETCGLHFHLSRCAFSQPAQFRLQRFVYANSAAFRKFSQRTKFSYCEFDSPSVHTMVDIARHRGTSSDRYVALNFTCSTIELRFNRGTLNSERFAQKLEMCFALHRFCKEPRGRSPSWDDIKKFIADNPDEWTTLAASMSTESPLATNV